MEWLEVLETIQKGENVSSKLIKKVESEDELGPILCAMANHEGGSVVVGYDSKNCHVLGTDIDREWLDQFVRFFFFPRVELSPSFITKNGKILLHLVVSASKEICFFKKQAFRWSPTGHIVVDEVESVPVVYEFPTPTYTVGNSQDQKETELVEIKASPVQDFVKMTSELIEAAQDFPSHVGETKGHDRPLTHRQDKAVDYLKKHFSISNKTYRALYKVSHKTAHLELVDLVSKGFLNQEGSGRSTCYILKK